MTTLPIVATIELMCVVNHVWSCCSASAIAVLDAPDAAKSAWTLTTAAWIAAMTSGMKGMKATAMRTITAVIDRIAPRVTAAAVFVRDQPRPLSQPAIGAKVAAMIPATRTEIVTVPRTVASHRTTTPRATVTRTRQPRAAR